MDSLSLINIYRLSARFTIALKTPRLEAIKEVSSSPPSKDNKQDVPKIVLSAKPYSLSLPRLILCIESLNQLISVNRVERYIVA